MQYHIDPFDRRHKVLWKDQHIKFSGVPYFVLGEKLLECQHGKDRNLGAKRKYQEKRVNKLCLLAGWLAKAHNSQLILTLVGGGGCHKISFEGFRKLIKNF